MQGAWAPQPLPGWQAAGALEMDLEATPETAEPTRRRACGPWPATLPSLVQSPAPTL